MRFSLNGFGWTLSTESGWRRSPQPLRQSMLLRGQTIGCLLPSGITQHATPAGQGLQNAVSLRTSELSSSANLTVLRPELL